jgi:hypothetical protein
VSAGREGSDVADFDEQAGTAEGPMALSVARLLPVGGLLAPMDPLEVNDDLRGNPNDVRCLLHHADARLASSLFAWYSRPRPSTGRRETCRERHRQDRRRSK